MSEINRDQMQILRDHFFSRQHELLALTCALVETESPSGDKEGSSAVVSLLASAAGSIGAVNSVERIASEDFGEHILIRAFANSDSESSLMILGHTDTVHPRGAIKERPWRTEGNRIYGPGVFDMKVNCALALEAFISTAMMGVNVPRVMKPLRSKADARAVLAELELILADVRPKFDATLTDFFAAIGDQASAGPAGDRRPRTGKRKSHRRSKRRR